jgi:D-ribose pyranase
MFVEKAFVSVEIAEYSPDVFELIQQALGEVPVEPIPHLQFKERTRNSKAIIRTGEFTPFANVILVSGPWGFEL